MYGQGAFTSYAYIIAKYIGLMQLNYADIILPEIRSRLLGRDTSSLPSQIASRITFSLEKSFPCFFNLLTSFLNCLVTCNVFIKSPTLHKAQKDSYIRLGFSLPLH